MEAFLQSPYLYLYLAIPIIGALVGWLTNKLAIRMTFYPLQRKRYFLLFGWQGIIPSKAESIANKSVDLMTQKLIDMKAVFARLEPEATGERILPQLKSVIKKIVQEAMETQSPILWQSVSDERKYKIYQSINKSLPVVLQRIFTEVRDQIPYYFDMRSMITEKLTQDRQMLNDVFLKCGRKEFKFIERSGIYFGFLFGIIQMILWWHFKPMWLLPLGGLIIGFTTNWLALKLIFHPQRPLKFLGLKIQGLFIKRQAEVSAEYAELVAGNMLNASQIYNRILDGPNSDRLVDLVHSQIDTAMDESMGVSKSLIQITSTTKRYEKIKRIIGDRLVEELPSALKLAFDYTNKTLAIEEQMREKMASMSPQDFVGVLRPAFQEDEFKLILVGAVLGCLTGIGQLVFLFG